MLKVIMNDHDIKSLVDIKACLAGLEKSPLTITVLANERLVWVEGVLKRIGYAEHNKADKGAIRAYLQALTGCSRQQVTRWIQRVRTHGRILQQPRRRHHFPRHYTPEDIARLAETDEAHHTLSGPATKKLFERAYPVYGERAYERLATISVSHLYHLRQSLLYRRKRHCLTKTKPKASTLGQRKKPQPQGQPGTIRVDTVHQGDYEKRKGVYHINAVDEVTQYQVIQCVEAISEQYLIPALTQLLTTFPFEIQGFHRDNSSEYVNRNVVQLLTKLSIEFTKSRARRSNDNALVECKNGAIIRNCLGYFHIPQHLAETINPFYQKAWIPYLNVHRPCYFPQVVVDARGKEKKSYPYELMMTPFEKLCSIPQVEPFLKPGVRLEQLRQEAMRLTDLQAAQYVNEQRTKRFQILEQNR